MTVQTNLQTALEAYIQANFTGTLAEISGAKLNLESLLQMQNQLNSTSSVTQLSNLISKDSVLVGETGAFHVSTPQEVISFSGFYFDAGSELWLEKDVTNGTVTHYPDARSFRVNVGTGSTDAITRQTNRIFPYFAGNEQSLHYGLYWDLQEGTKVEAGYGDEANGFFFLVQKVSGVYQISLLVRNSASGSLVETVIPQSQWNIDKLDGTGMSGITLDPTKGQMLAMYWTWYGYGSIVWMIKIDGFMYSVHRYAAGNNTLLPLIGEPNQAIRYKIWNTIATAGNSYIQVSGLALRDNGASPEQRRGFARSTPLPTSKNVTNGNTYVLMSFRPKVTHKGRNNRGLIGIRNYWLSGSATGSIGLYYNPVLTSPSWVDVDTNNSFAQYDISATVATGGILIDSGGLSSNRGSDKTLIPDSRDSLAPLSDFSGTNHISLVFKCNGNGSLDFGFNWNEFI